MMKNPSVNAILAGVYIIVIINMLQFATQRTPSGEGSVIIPITILSLFTLSAATMGYLFLGNPIMLYIDGKKKEAVRFFFQTVGTFAAISVIFLGLLLSGVFF